MKRAQSFIYIKFLVSLTFIAVLSFIISRAFAVIATDSINTGASVLARLVHGTHIYW